MEIVQAGYEYHDCAAVFHYPGQIPVWKGEYAHQYVRNFISPPPGPPSMPSDLVQIAKAKFMSDVSEQLSPFKGLTFLGELKDTLRMIRRPASAFRDGFSSYLKRAHRTRSRIRDVKTANQMIAGSWLEYVYGWRPLMGDVESAVDAYAQYNAKAETARVYGKAERRWNDSAGVFGENFPSYNYKIVTIKSWYYAKCVYKGVIRLPIEGIDIESADNLKRLSGFKLEEFIPTVWELVPYSFVVDYFSNVGGILNSIPALGAEYVWHSRATTSESHRVHATRPDLSPQNVRLTRNIQEFKDSNVVVRSYRRDQDDMSSLPSLVARLPQSPWVWTNLAALLAVKWK
jgi:hypothetical protein